MVYESFLSHQGVTHLILGMSSVCTWCFFSFPSTRRKAFRLKEGRFKLDIRKKSFTGRVVRCWNGLRREAVAALSLAVFKARFDGTLSNLIY